MNPKKLPPSHIRSSNYLLYDITGYFTGNDYDDPYQPHKLRLRAGCYAIHLPTGKAGMITNKYASAEGVTYGLAYDSEYSECLLRRITPAQYKRLPKECKIVSQETAIF